MFRTCLNKRNDPDVPEAVIQEAVRAVMEMRLSVKFAASRYGMNHTTLHRRI
jgi:transposase-like protein